MYLIRTVELHTMRMNWSVQIAESNVCTVCFQRVSDSFALQEVISLGIQLQRVLIKLHVLLLLLRLLVIFE